MNPLRPAQPRTGRPVINLCPMDLLRLAVTSARAGPGDPGEQETLAHVTAEPLAEEPGEISVPEKLVEANC